MKNIKVSVIIRTFNESKWINLCISKLKNQTIKPYEIIVVDNHSSDGTKKLVKQLNKDVKIFNFTEEYFPGKMLNFGISKTKGNYILIISAHCIPYNKDLIKNLVNPLIENKKICASYSRQIPLSFSDNTTIRDLTLLYGPEDRLQTNDPKFNNACSLIRKTEWQNTKFNEKLTNLEDRYWASQKIKKKKFIFYSSLSVVYHYHGTHQNENIIRLKNTTNVIKKNKINFHLLPGSLNFSEKDILPVLVLRSTNLKNLTIFLKNLSNQFNEKILVFAKDKIKNKSIKKKINFITRKKSEISNKNLFLSEVIDFYKKDIIKNIKNTEYLLVYTDNYKFLTSTHLKKILNIINNKFPDTIFYVEPSIELMFFLEQDVATKINSTSNFRKNPKKIYISKRDYGIVIHRSNLCRKDKFDGNIKIFY